MKRFAGFRFRAEFPAAMVALGLLAAVLIGLAHAADTTISQFDVKNQAYRSLKIKDNNDSTFSFQTQAVPIFPGTFVVGTSTGGNQANSPTLPAVSGKVNYCAGFTVTGLGATGASTLTVTLSDGTKTLNYTYEVVAGATTQLATLSEKFNPPLPATASNTAWTLTVGAFGSGNTAASANIWGYVQ